MMSDNIIPPLYFDLLLFDPEALSAFAFAKAEEGPVISNDQLPMLLKAASKLLDNADNDTEMKVSINLSCLVENVNSVTHKALLTAYDHGLYSFLLPRVTLDTLNTALRYEICNERNIETIKFLLSEGAKSTYKPTQTADSNLSIVYRRRQNTGTEERKKEDELIIRELLETGADPNDIFVKAVSSGLYSRRLNPKFFKNYAAQIRRQVLSDAIVEIARSMVLDWGEKNKRVSSILDYRRLTFDDVSWLLNDVNARPVHTLLETAVRQLGHQKLLGIPNAQV